MLGTLLDTAMNKADQNPLPTDYTQEQGLGINKQILSLVRL